MKQMFFWNSLAFSVIQKLQVKVTAQSHQTLCDPMDYTVHGVLQARILEWVAYPFSSGSSQPRNQTGSPELREDSLPAELPGKPPENVGHWSLCSSAFSKLSLYIWKFLVYILLKLNLKGFVHNLTSLWNEHNCMTVWTFLGPALLWDWNKNWPFPVLLGLPFIVC